MDTIYIAIIGAITGIVGTITGTAALLWDGYKWYDSERVRLEVSANPNMKMIGDLRDDNYIMVNVVNIGKIPTTIKLISLHGFETTSELKNRNGTKSGVMNPAKNLEIMKLPHKLEPGDD